MPVELIEARLPDFGVPIAFAVGVAKQLDHQCTATAIDDVLGLEVVAMHG